jgi:GNAT superfamily N-acetyltransferase
MCFDVTRDDGFTVSDDPARLDFDVVHGYLKRSYWSPGVSRSVVERAAKNSLACGLYAPDGRQVGYVRAITDKATFANLADVFVLEEFRGKDLGAFMVDAVLKHPDLQGLRRITLASRDARGLYARFGFVPLGDSEMKEMLPRFMIKLSPQEKRNCLPETTAQRPPLWARLSSYMRASARRMSSAGSVESSG